MKAPTIVKKAAVAVSLLAPGSNTSAQTPTTSALNLAPTAVSWADRQKTPLENIFDGMELHDQYNQAIDPALFSKGEVIVMFGFNGCKMCMGSETKPGIADTVAAMQQELLRQGKNIPIVVVSVTPQEDRTEEQRQAYITSYGKKGVKQFANQKLPATDEALDAAYIAGASKKPQERLLHIVYPPSAQHAETLQLAMGLIQHPKKAEQHSTEICLFVNGVQQQFIDKADKSKVPAINAIPLGRSSTKSYQDLGVDIAKQFMAKAPGISR